MYVGGGDDVFLYPPSFFVLFAHSPLGFFLYKGELRIVEPAHRHRRGALSALQDLEVTDLVAYTYSTKLSDSDAYEFMNTAIHGKYKQIDVGDNVATLVDHVDERVVQHGRRLTTQPSVFDGCIPWTNTPYGIMDATCPSTTKELGMGVASDTGYTKALTGYGTDASVTVNDAIAMVEEDAQGNNNILNVLYGKVFGALQLAFLDRE